MGANLVADGATFRIWAPGARSVTLRATFSGWNDCPMQLDAEGYWDVFVSGAREGAGRAAADRQRCARPRHAS